MARTVEDAAILLEAIAGYDRLDPTSVERPPVRYTAALKQPVAGFRLGRPEGYFDDLDPQVAEAVEAAMAVLSGMTRGARAIRLPAAEDYGARGAISAEAYAFQEPYLKRQPDDYLPVIRKRFEAMGRWSASEYIQAREALERLRRSMDATFADVDLIVAPSEKGLAPPLAAMIERSLGGGQSLPGAMTTNLAPFDIYGLPAISIPCGFSRDGLPVGLMIAGPRFAEDKVLALAAAYEAATNWSRRRPPLAPDTPVPPVGGYAWRPAPRG
jgi:aspartyl-tRNA(Asn)/glutamyl-tRNA(Gln) amidotransferase subunit A